MGLLGKLFGRGGEGTAVGAAPAKAVLLEKIRQSELFRDLPAENLERMFQKMESVAMRRGEVVLREGDEGDYYYLLVSGKAEVSRTGDAGKNEKVAELTEPTGFGEEALISKAKRNATVTMKEAGVVMRLSKDAFDEFVKEPLVTWYAPREAQDLVSKGAMWIDVREPEDAQQAHFHGALSMPVKDVRARSGELDKNVLYVCYCQNGRLSSTAAFLLRQRGFKVGVLRGGLQSLQRAGVT